MGGLSGGDDREREKGGKCSGDWNLQKRMNVVFLVGGGRWLVVD